MRSGFSGLLIVLVETFLFCFSSSFAPSAPPVVLSSPHLVVSSFLHCFLNFPRFLLLFAFPPLCFPPSCFFHVRPSQFTFLCCFFVFLKLIPVFPSSGLFLFSPPLSFMSSFYSLVPFPPPLPSILILSSFPSLLSTLSFPLTLLRHLFCLFISVCLLVFL